MAKINHITIKDVTRYLETIAYLPELPTATEDSADLVSVNNTLYVKQVTDGVYSYGTIQAGDAPTGDGVTIIEMNIDFADFMENASGDIDGLEYTYNLSEEEVQLFLTATDFHLVKYNLNILDSYAVSMYYLPIMSTNVGGELNVMYAPSLGTGMLGIMYQADLGLRCIEGMTLSISADKNTLVLSVAPNTTPLIDLTSVLENDSITIGSNIAEHLMSGQAVKIDDLYFRVPYINADGSYMLSAYDAENDEWLHLKETAYDDETGKYTFTFDEEDHSSPYGDGGAGGSSVVVNSSDEATGTLTKLTVDGVTYGVPVVEIEDLTSL